MKRQGDSCMGAFFVFNMGSMIVTAQKMAAVVQAFVVEGAIP